MTRSLADQTEYVKALLYGEQGTGKTTALASMARLGRVIYIDAESGLKSRPLRDLGVPVEDIEVYRPRAYDEYDKLYWDVKEELEDGLAGKLPAGKKPIAGVVFDSFTEIQKSLIEQIVEKRVERKTKQGMESDPFFTERDDYGRMTEQVRRLTRRFRDLPCHIGFGALQKREVESDGVVYLPALTPAFMTDLMGYVDIIVCHSVTHDYGTPEYVGVTKPIGKFRGKDRFNALPTTLANPTFDRLVELVNDDLDIATDDNQNEFLRRRKAKEAS